MNMKVNILKSFKFCGNKYVAGQYSPSKRFPTIPFNELQLKVLVDMKHVSIEEDKVVAKVTPKADTEKKATK